MECGYEANMKTPVDPHQESAHILSKNLKFVCALIKLRLTICIKCWYYYSIKVKNMVMFAVSPHTGRVD